MATDLDGTLVRTDGTVDERTCRALRLAEEAGALVVFVTGRPPRWMDAVADLIGRSTVAVCANGAIVYDMRAERIVTSTMLEVEVLREVTGRLRAALPTLSFAVEYGTDFGREPGYRHAWDIGIPDVRIGPCPDILDQPAAKLLAHDGEADPDVLRVLAEELVGPLATVTTSARVGLLEISAPGISKATALAELAGGHGVTAEGILAFGDMPNDLPVLTLAGHSVAVANAHPDVLATVDEVTASNDEHGVALVLERIFGAFDRSGG